MMEKMFKAQIAIGDDTDMDLLWTNPTPTAAMAAQTITESSTGWVSGRHLSDYTHIVVDFIDTATIIVPITNINCEALRIYMYQSNRVLMYQRVVSAEYSTGISVKNAYYYSQGAAGSAFTESVMNTVSVPTKIYGMKVAS